MTRRQLIPCQRIRNPLRNRVPPSRHPPAREFPLPETPTLNYATTNTNRWVRISNFATPVEAQLARLALDNAGIRTQIAARARAASVYGVAPANMEILVMADDEAAARNLLAEIIQNRKARMERRYATCPVCRRADSIPIAAPRWNFSHALELSVAGILICFGIGISQLFFTGTILIFAAALLIDVTRRMIHPPKTWRQGVSCGHRWLPGAADDLLDEDDDEPAASHELDRDELDDEDAEVDLDDEDPDAGESGAAADNDRGSPS